VRAIVRKGLLAVAAFVGVLLGGVIVTACLTLATGCGAATQQRIVSITAISAATADDLAATAWETGADIIAAEVETDEFVPEDGQFAEWCERAADLWDGTARAACFARALGNVAIAGQRAIDAVDGDEVDTAAWVQWAGVAAAAVAALVNAWEGVPDTEPPSFLVEADNILRLYLGDGLAPRCDVTPIPQCPAVP
jgi:hypothetical protein